jgi:hypothetical protein
MQIDLSVAPKSKVQATAQLRANQLRQNYVLYQGSDGLWRYCCHEYFLRGSSRPIRVQGKIEIIKPNTE